MNIIKNPNVSLLGDNFIILHRKTLNSFIGDMS
ncbi:unnamed protein product, partial [marine sediment metagenome]